MDLGFDWADPEKNLEKKYQLVLVGRDGPDGESSNVLQGVPERSSRPSDFPRADHRHQRIVVAGFG